MSDLAHNFVHKVLRAFACVFKDAFMLAVKIISEITWMFENKKKKKKQESLTVQNKFVALPGQFKRQGDLQSGSFKFMLGSQCKLCSLAICRNLKDLQVL